MFYELGIYGKYDGNFAGKFAPAVVRFRYSPTDYKLAYDTWKYIKGETNKIQ